MATHKPPPNYLSRRFQTRLLVMVAALGIVVFMMNEARKPENWRWFERLGQQPTNRSNTRFNTRLRPQKSEQRDGPVVTAEKPLSLQIDQLDQDADARDVWHIVLKRLPAQVRDWLADAVFAARTDLPATDERVPRGLAYLDDLDPVWDSVARLASDRGLDVTSAQALWKEVKAALLRWLHDEPLGTSDPQTLARFDQLLDELACRDIRDNSVLQPEERTPWYRLMRKLRQGARAGHDESSRAVTYAQLFSQPDVYRCRLVTLRGDVRLVERLPASANRLGIETTYRLWLRPDDGTNDPIVVYCLELPPGFPAPPRSSEESGEHAAREVDEPVELTGYFFKRWAYQSRQGLRLAPLVLSRSPKWYRVFTRSEDWASGTWTVLLVSLASAIVLSIIVSIYLWRRPLKEESLPSVEHLRRLRESSGE